MRNHRKRRGGRLDYHLSLGVRVASSIVMQIFMTREGGDRTGVDEERVKLRQRRTIFFSGDLVA